MRFKVIVGPDGEMYKIILHSGVVSVYERLDKNTKTRVSKVLDALRINPYHGSNIKRLTGKLHTFFVTG